MSRQRSVLVTTRFTPEEANRIRDAARARGLSYSAMIRLAVYLYANPGMEIRPDHPNIWWDCRQQLAEQGL